MVEVIENVIKTVVVKRIEVNAKETAVSVTETVVNVTKTVANVTKTGVNVTKIAVMTNEGTVHDKKFFLLRNL